MSGTFTLRRVGPAVTVQDLGRPGWLSYGVSRGGAADRLALHEAAALLGHAVPHAALEMQGLGVEGTVDQDIRIALTGAEMRCTLDGVPLAWNAVHIMPKGAHLVVGAAKAGVYGYLSFGGGIAGPEQLGSQSAHLIAGLGARLQSGDALPLGPDLRAADPDSHGLGLPAQQRFSGGEIRMVSGPQTALFSAATLCEFQATPFRIGTRGTRMGVDLLATDTCLNTPAGLSILSEVIVPGDIQITGDGTPYVLLSECQTTGGYPRIGTVLPCDLPKLAQAQPGTSARFTLLSHADGVAAEARAATHRDTLVKSLFPLIRDPAQIRDLLGYQLISGVTAGAELSQAANKE